MKKFVLALVFALTGSIAGAQYNITPASGSVSSGTSISGCTAYSLVYIDSAGKLACAQAAQNSNVSTAGNAITQINATISGTSATSNFVNINGAFPATLTAQTNGLYFTFALDNDAQVQEGLQLNLTGTGPAAATYGILANNQASGSTGVGIYGTNAGSHTVRYGGLFTFDGSNPSAASAALAANNGTTAADIFRAEDNGSSVFTIADGGFVRATVGHSYLSADYTNATTTFSNTALSVSVESGRKYRFVATLFVTDSTAADGSKIDFNGGSAAATNFIGTCVLANAVGTVLAQTAATTAALATALNIAALTDTAVHVYNCSGGFEPSGAGTFIIRGAQNAHTTGTLTIKRGSWLSLVDTP